MTEQACLYYLFGKRSFTQATSNSNTPAHRATKRTARLRAIYEALEL